MSRPSPSANPAEEEFRCLIPREWARIRADSMPATDADLLRLFIRHRDEEAFRILAERYLDLIYGAALRRSGHRQIAEEAAQNVLGLLVRKAPDLVNETAVLPGWLHRAATFEAANLLRTERRYQERKEALMRHVSDPTSPPDPAWKQVVPHLDAALARLPAIDRSIVLMHYLQGKTHREIASTIGKRHPPCNADATGVLEN